ncbi:SRPBCC domain-containing protein [Umezawaea endophytica]|uniref:SRPBCC domain-containing protein n=1 Tax=Umezawaea endophytica TaxID=1654476 RepID=A0A9X2VU94_9PSEU|nr:SRPBCC domain-containing protein [Umezawaea endophytica]MCS7482928.1 SRPBCC domain-containing protein [Umezawaea endophytica]
MIGKTKDAGWEIGVSKTVPYPLEHVWDYLSGPGLAVWLGDVRLEPEKGAPYETAEGTVGEIRGYHEQEKIRLTWRPKDWDHDSTVQVGLRRAGPGKTVVVFHQERLTGPDERVTQREHWRAVMKAVVVGLGG